VYPHPCLVGIGVRVRGNPQGPPQTSGRGGDGALEGPYSVEVISPSVRCSGAAPSIEWAALSPAGAAGVAEGATGALGALAMEGAAGAAPVVSSLPPRWGAQTCQESVRLPLWVVHPRTHGSLFLRWCATASPV
jgi:hypothetical protein